MSSPTRKNRIYNGIRHVATGVGNGVKYLLTSNGLRHDIAHLHRTRRNNHYKKLLLNIKKKILKQQYVLDELERKEKSIYEKFKNEEEIYNYNQKYNNKFQQINRDTLRENKRKSRRYSSLRYR